MARSSIGLGRGPLKAERRVRFPYALPLAGLQPALDQLIPFQIIFNPTSARELSKLPKEFQLEVLGDFRGFPQDVRSQDLERFGKLERQGKRLYRYRLGDYRVYFERSELGIIIHRILNRNTLKDFLFRSRLPTGEDEALQDNPKFWELMETSSESSPH